MNHPQIRCLKFSLAIALAICMIVSTGCKQQLKTGYGRSRGREFTSSVNGTVVLSKMIKSSDRRVDHYKKVSPRWYDYDTIFWIPDNFSSPRPEAISKAEQWLQSDRDKTLVFVARDYDAAVVYWDQLRKSSNHGGSSPGDRNSRDYADALSQHFSKSNVSGDQNCDWFDWSVGPFQRAQQVSGVLANELDTANADIYYGSLPAPGNVTQTGTFNGYDVEVLLSVDSIPMVYSLTKDDWQGSRIIVVGNGSLILNLPLTNPTNRQLSARLLEKVDEIDNDWNKVLFVENQNSITVSDVDVPEQASKWSWITKPPLRYMVPNLVFWCMLFCFVYFPIFGRPRRIQRKSTANFRDHIFALARLLSGSRSREHPTAWLEQYRKNSNRKQKLR